MRSWNIIPASGIGRPLFYTQYSKTMILNLQWRWVSNVFTEDKNHDQVFVLALFKPKIF
jgi:hypothetical protein